MQSSHPERKPHLTPTPPISPQKAASDANYASRTLLLRICWLLLGSTLFIVIGLTLFAVLLKGTDHPSTTPQEQLTAKQEEEAPMKSNETAQKEPLPIDPEPEANAHPDRLNAVDRVLGGSFHPSRGDDAASLTDSPPPLPPPPLKTQPIKSSAHLPSLSPVPPQLKGVDDRLEERLQSSEEDLRQQLLAVPELRLFSDLVVQNYRESEKKDESKVRGVPRGQIDFAYNAQMHSYMRQAGLKEGLLLQSGPNCQLDPDTAMLVQTLSKDLRDMGFVSVPGAPVRVKRKSAGRVANVGTTAHNGSPNEKIEAFKEWCDVNTIEKFRGALATLQQVLQVEDAPMRLLLVRELAKAQGPEATAALANRALVDLAPEVRQAAIAALEKRPAGQYVPVLLKGLRYPWAPVADHAALALRKLKPQGVVPKLIEMLDRSDPSLPILDKRTNKPLVRELVRLNHMRNCLLCHAPSAHDKDGLVRGLVPTPGQPLPRLYYAGQKGNFVRADIAFLRQDFSINLPVAAAAPWPNEQRFDFVTRDRPAKPEEIAAAAAKSDNYPQRDAALYALRGLTGKDGGEKSDKWRELLGIAKDEKR